MRRSRLFRKKIDVGPKEMAYTAIGLAHQRADQLRKERMMAEDQQADDVIKELFRAYFCLANLHAARYLQHSVHNSYRAAMLNFLREYEGALVRETFLEAQALNEAIACYVRGKLSPQDRKATDDCRQLLRLSEDNAL